jgi:hypothetical protein
MQPMEVLKNIRQDLWPEVSLIRKGLTMKKCLLRSKIYLDHDYTFIGRYDEMEGAPDGCKDNLLEW